MSKDLKLNKMTWNHIGNWRKRHISQTDQQAFILGFFKDLLTNIFFCSFFFSRFYVLTPLNSLGRKKSKSSRRDQKSDKISTSNASDCLTTLALKKPLCTFQRCLTHFLQLVSFYSPSKYQQNQRFSDFFRGYRKRPVASNKSNSRTYRLVLFLCCEFEVFFVNPTILWHV